MLTLTYIAFLSSLGCNGFSGHEEYKYINQMNLLKCNVTKMKQSTKIFLHIWSCVYMHIRLRVYTYIGYQMHGDQDTWMA